MASPLPADGEQIVALGEKWESLYAECETEEKAALDRCVNTLQALIDADLSGRHDMKAAITLLAFRLLIKELQT